MKQFFALFHTTFIALIIALVGLTSSAKADAYADNCLVLPPIPDNEADGFIRLTYGSAPNYPGIPPESSLFTVDIQPGGSGSPTPPIPSGRYAAWCFDMVTDLPTGRRDFQLLEVFYMGATYFQPVRLPTLSIRFFLITQTLRKTVFYGRRLIT